MALKSKNTPFCKLRFPPLLQTIATPRQLKVLKIYSKGT